MPAIITNEHRIIAGDYFQNYLHSDPTYVFIGGTSPWTNENFPPDIEDTVLDKISVYDEMVGAKRIQKADIISVLPRINWRAGVVFDQYSDRVNLIDDDNPETTEPYKFYVITDEFNVYKCISNNDRSTSSTKPSGASINRFQTPDGYVWKFMYSVKPSDAFTYMTPNWIPCYSVSYNDNSSQWLVQQASVEGTVDNLIITDSGTGYSPLSPPTVTITGNGSGATATAQVDNVSGIIKSITITNNGSGYSYASIDIVSNGSGVGATASPIISPYRGHGKDARTELGAIYKMVRVVFDSDEGLILPTDVSYRKAGIISLPTLSGVTGTILAVTDLSLFSTGETITGATSSATGIINNIDQVNGYIYVSSVVGTFVKDENVSSQTYNSTQVLDAFGSSLMPVTTSVVNGADIEYLSGELLYVSNREKIARGNNQKEEIKFIISF